MIAYLAAFVSCPGAFVVVGEGMDAVSSWRQRMKSWISPCLVVMLALHGFAGIAGMAVILVHSNASLIAFGVLEVGLVLSYQVLFGIMVVDDLQLRVRSPTKHLQSGPA